MDLRPLRCFVAVAEERSFTRAAARLNLGQPSLSVTIKDLESEIGGKLFDRNRHGVVLTATGETMMRGAQDILAKVAETSRAVRRSFQGEIGTVSIGLSSDVPLAHPFQAGLREYRRMRPDVRIDLMSMTATAQIEGLRAGEVDVGFLRWSPGRRLPNSLAVLTIHEDRLAAVLPKGHKLSETLRPISVQALRSEPVVFFPPGIGVHDHVAAICARYPLELDVVQTMRDGPSIISLVAANLGVTILPSIYARSSTAAVTFLELSEHVASSRILMVWRRRETAPQILAFIKGVSVHTSS